MDFSRDRQEGARKFRAHKQHLVILDADAFLDLTEGAEESHRVLQSAFDNHRLWMRSLFLKHVAFFWALVLPIWLGLLWVMWRG